MTVTKLELQAPLNAGWLERDYNWEPNVTVNPIITWTDCTTVLQWIKSIENQPIFVTKRACKILEYTSVDQWNHVATKENPAESCTLKFSVEVLHLSIWVKSPHLLNISIFWFVPIKEVISNIKLGSNKALAIEEVVSLATSIKNRQLQFLRSSRLISLVLVKNICALTHTFSGSCRNMPGTLSLVVSVLILLSSTKLSVMSSTW